MGGGSYGGWNQLGDVRSLEERAREALRAGKRNVFISFATEDMSEVNLLRAHSKNELSEIEFNDHSVQEPYNSERAEYIKQRISERINRCSTTIVYLSADTAQSKWVKWEVDESRRLGKTVIAVHSGARFDGPRPAWLGEHQIRVVPWSQLSNELR